MYVLKRKSWFVARSLTVLKDSTKVIEISKRSVENQMLA